MIFEITAWNRESGGFGDPPKKTCFSYFLFFFFWTFELRKINLQHIFCVIVFLYESQKKKKKTLSFITYEVAFLLLWFLLLASLSFSSFWFRLLEDSGSWFCCLLIFPRFTILSICVALFTSFTLKMTLALLNIPSLSDIIMNWEWEKCVLNICPIFCVLERSRASSISSRMYIGAGLKRRRDRMRDKASKELHYFFFFFFWIVNRHD